MSLQSSRRATVRHRRIVALALAAVLAIPACSPTTTESSQQQDSSVDQATTGSGDDTLNRPGDGQDDPQLSFFPEGLVDDLNALQWAIDLRFDQDRVQCLREAGWDVRPNSLESIQNNTSAVGPVSQLQLLLAEEATDDVGNTTNDPNSGYYATLSEQELVEMYEQNSTCVTQSEWNRGHPLGVPGTVYADAYAAAGSRVSANEEYLVSLARADRCFEDAGFGPRSEALVSLSSQAIDVMVQLEAREIDRDTALDAAERLESLQEEIEALETRCYETHNRFTGTLFTSELSNEIARSPELQTEILRLETFVAEYRDILDEIEASS